MRSEERRVGKDPKEDADHRNKGKERQQQGNKAITSVAFIEVIQSKRPAKSQEGELDECLLFQSLHGWKFCITTYIAMVSPKILHQAELSANLDQDSTRNRRDQEPKLGSC